MTDEELKQIVRDYPEVVDMCKKYGELMPERKVMEICIMKAVTPRGVFDVSAYSECVRTFEEVADFCDEVLNIDIEPPEEDYDVGVL